MNLFDASALIAFLQGEDGAEVVEEQLLVGGACSAVNWSETAQKLLAHDQDWGLSRGLLLTYGLEVVPVLSADAEAAARIWKRGGGLSLADRLCLATGQRLRATVWTADKRWGSTQQVRQIRGE